MSAPAIYRPNSIVRSSRQPYLHPLQPTCQPVAHPTGSIIPTVSKSTLKITRHDDQEPPWNVSFAVWNPITASYESMASLDDGLFRLGDLAEQVRLMWVRHDPARTSLKDAPDPAHDDDSEWAELRASAQANRVYETRKFDQTGWKKATGRTAAIETICNEVGHVP